MKDDARGPAGGFVYKRKQNSKGEEVGGIVPHVTLKSIANNEPPDEEVLVDRPEVEKDHPRDRPVCVEATIPTAQDFEEARPETGDSARRRDSISFVDRMLEFCGDPRSCGSKVTRRSR